MLLLTETIGLVWLYLSVQKYDAFWSDKSREGGSITYLALGDSTAQGIGATSPLQGYVGLIAKEIERRSGKSVRIVNLSKTGAKLEDYLETQAPKISKINADIVTIEIGANNIGEFNASKFRVKFKQVLKTLPSGSFVANMPLFNSRPSSTQDGKTASKIIEEELKSQPTLTLVDLQKETTENQNVFGFAPDLFHPNNLTYRHWANAFLKQIPDRYR